MHAAPALLHLDASAGPPEESVSRRLTARYADAWRQRHGTGGYRYRDLSADPVPLIGPAYISLGRRVERGGGVPPHKVAALARSAAEVREWSLTLPLISELRGADTVLLGVPMYNFSVPATLKCWIDRVSFPAAFTDPDTGAPALDGTKVIAVLARGGAYGPGTPRHGCDFQEPYLRAYFARLGVRAADLHVVRADMTIADVVPGLAEFRELGARSLAAAEEAVEALAEGLAGVAGRAGQAR